MASDSASTVRVQSRLDHSYRVRFDECLADGRLPASGFLRYAQDLAWRHSAAAGFDRRWYAERRMTWLIRALELDVLEAVSYGEELTVSTEVLGFRRSWARRRSEFSLGTGERPLAVAAIDWLLLNAGGAPARVPAQILGAFETPPVGTFTPLRISLPGTPANAEHHEFAVRRTDLDPLGHVNNGTYLDYIDDMLVLAGRQTEVELLPRRYRLEFVAPAELGMTLRAALWSEEPALCYRLKSAAGSELVRARVETDLATWVGG